MLETRIIKVKSIENEEIIIAITMAKAIITAIMKIIAVIMKTIRIKTGSCLKTYKKLYKNVKTEFKVFK